MTASSSQAGATTDVDAGRPPRITVITPSFNQAPFLRACIDSVLAQDWPDLEYRVLDGGSTDGSREILESYGDAITWRSHRDGGQAAAIREGFEKATGEIVAWLNSDDYYLPGAFAHAVVALSADPGAAGVHGRADIVDVDGRTLRPYPSFDFTRRDLRRKCYVCQPTVFLRRSTLVRHGLPSDALDLCFDYDWWLRITRSDRFAFCDAPLAATRHYPATKTASRRSRALVEAGYVLRHHFGEAPWRWSAKWVVHRLALSRGRSLPGALRSARDYRRRFRAD
ncbi:MAG: glycosyltransferase, partial [Myxococcales bacterium]|nr:glycosyltransferase [Myxococcales bacterium]